MLRKTINYLPESIAPHIVAIISFADSKYNEPLPGPFRNKHISLCKPGDWVCDKEYNILTGVHYSSIYLPFLDLVVGVLQERIREGGRDSGDRYMK